MKKEFLLRPEEVNDTEVWRRLIGSRLGCAEIENETATELEVIARKAIQRGERCCDITSFMSQSPVRYEDRNSPEIRISNEIFRQVMTERVFEVLVETADAVYLGIKK